MPPDEAKPGSIRSDGAGADRKHHQEHKRGSDLSSPALAQRNAARSAPQHDSPAMRLRPSRIAREQGTQGARALRRLSAEFGRHRGGSPRARGAGFIGSGSPLQQRSLVKISYARNKGRGAWRAQGRYLSRAGAQREGEKGLGFDAEREDLSLPDQLGSWQKAGDRRLWKIVVSPEAGSNVDLQAHARDLMAQIQADLGTRLEWVAIDHHDTDHPHVHIVIRGIDAEGKALLISRDYIRSGVRARSQELLTRSLGHRQDHDRKLARERSVEAPRITEIDRSLLARADASRAISFEDPIPRWPAAQQRRLQDIRRLQYLETLGLAKRIGDKEWQLSSQLLPALRQIQMAGDVQKSLARSRALVTDRDAPLVFTRIEPGVELTGRVAGGGLDESRDEPLLILEGTDGNRHLIPQTPEIHGARGAGRLRPGAVVTIRGGAASRGDRRSIRTEVIEHGPLRDLKRADTASTALDLDALRSVRESGMLPEPPSGRRGFFRQWQAAVRDRGPLLEREGLIRRQAAPEKTFEVEKGAERMVEGRLNHGGRVPTTLRELERDQGRRVAVAKGDPGETHQGDVVAYAVEDDGKRFVVLDTGAELMAVQTDRRDLELGQAVRARAEVAEGESRARRVLTWALDDLEHEQDRGRGR